MFIIRDRKFNITSGLVSWQNISYTIAFFLFSTFFVYNISEFQARNERVEFVERLSSQIDLRARYRSNLEKYHLKIVDIKEGHSDPLDAKQLLHNLLEKIESDNPNLFPQIEALNDKALDETNNSLQPTDTHSIAPYVRKIITLIDLEQYREISLTREILATQNLEATKQIKLSLVLLFLTCCLTILPTFSRPQSLVTIENTKNQFFHKLFKTQKTGESHFKIAFDAAPNAMIMVNTRGSIVLHNAKASELFQYSSEEFSGITVDTLVPEEMQKSHFAFRNEYLKDPKSRAMGGNRELFARRKNGKYVSVEIGLMPVKISNEVFVISSILDITSRVQGQIKMQNLNRLLLEKNKEMEQLLFAISHDLRAPLITIGGFSNRLKTTLSDMLTEAQKLRFDRILANVDLMDSLLQDLLNLSRVIKQGLAYEWVQPEELIEKVTLSLEGQVTKKRNTNNHRSKTSSNLCQ